MKVLTLLSFIFLTSAYSPLTHRHITSKFKLFDATIALIKKGKIKEVELLKKELSNDKENMVNKFLETSKFMGTYGEKAPFIKSVYNRYTSVTVMPEYSKKVKTVGKIIDDFIV